MKVPSEGEVWKHYKGNRYQIEGLARNESDQKIVVVYRNIEDRTLWVRTLNSFMSLVEDGPRFSLIPNT